MLQKVLVNLQVVEGVDRYLLDKIVSYFVLIHIIYTILSFIKLPPDPSWIVELTSYALRIILWIVFPILIFPCRKDLWLIMGAAILNVPSGISDIVYIDKYDNTFIFLKLLFLIPALYIVIGKFFTIIPITVNKILYFIGDRCQVCIFIFTTFLLQNLRKLWRHGK